jgi:hypothetical protein
VYSSGACEPIVTQASIGASGRSVGVVPDDVGQQLWPDDIEQRFAPVLEIVGHDLHDRVTTEPGPDDGHRHR